MSNAASYAPTTGLGPVDATFDGCPLDVIIVPGGLGPRHGRRRIVDWVAAAHPTTTFTTSVCTGSLVPGAPAAHRPDGDDALERSPPERFDAEPNATSRLAPRSANLTAAGVSAGIDMALRLVELLVDETGARAR